MSDEVKEGEKTKNKGGRPTAYKEEYNKQALKLCKLGFVDTQLSEFFEVTTQTIDNWKVKYPKFFGAVKKGRIYFDNNRIEAALVDRALGYEHDEEKVFCNNGEITTHVVTKKYPPDVGAIKLWLLNRNPKEYRERQEIDHTTQGDKITPPVINFGK